MTILREATFAGLSIGTAATAANTDFDASGFDGATNVVGVAALTSGQAVRFTGTGIASFYWHFAARTSLYSRGYLKVDNAGTANQTFAWVNQQGGAQNSRVAEVRFRSTQRDFQLRSNTATAVATSTAYALGTTVRWEWFINRAGTTQTLRLYSGANLNGTTPDQTITGTTGAGDATFNRFGCVSMLVQAGTPDVTFDKFAIGDDWIGPHVATDPGADEPFEFVEWNGTTLAPLTVHEWSGSILTGLETAEV